MLGALTFALKLAMAPLPNIEPVSLLLIVYSLVFGYKAFYPLFVYICMENLVYGISLWSIGYLYMWPMLIVCTLLIFKVAHSHNTLVWSIVSGIYGLLFGALYIPLYVISGGAEFACSWWINGLAYDIIHGSSNFILCLVLFNPLIKTLDKLEKKIITTI